MSKITALIKQPIEQEMKLFEEKFYQSMKSSVPMLDRITHFIVRRKGKQMRPMFVFLCAKMVGKINEKTYRAASLIELIHTATLVHDDVVDDSYLRRGFFSINALWKNKVAVLVGDYLLSKSVLLSTDYKDYDLLSVISNTIREMSEGELLQLEKARKLDITEEKLRLKTHLDYFIVTMEEAAAGRKLGFITQEIGREINTIGSKANDSGIQKLVVQMKDELEKVKEQLLNVL